MKILVSNDDGYDAPGIQALFGAMEAIGEVVAVAPLENRSGASSSLSLNRSISVAQVDERMFAVDGTPSDCVHLALTGRFMPWRPDIVVSGINNGENMGDDTIYSGTVAAALEAAQFGVQGIAVSMAAKPAGHYETGAEVARRVVLRLIDKPLSDCLLLNVNVPDIPVERLKGILRTRLGRRHFSESAREIEKAGDPKVFHYEYGEAGAAQDAGEGTDFHAIRSMHASATPLDIDLTDHQRLDHVHRWLEADGEN